MAKIVLKKEFGTDILTLYCDACKSNHTFTAHEHGVDKFDGNIYNPTIDKLIHCESIIEDIARDNNCSFYVKNGYIQYTNSCRHPCYGKSCELMDYSD
jgi:hypothetical protein